MTNWIAVLIATCALVMSGFSIYLSEVRATADYKVSQDVKKDTIQLFVTLTSIIRKGAVYQTQDKDSRDDPKSSNYVDIDNEISVIKEFLISPTSFAYARYASKKSAEAKAEGQPEKWRIFFLQLIYLTLKQNPHEAATAAAEIMKKYFNFSEENTFENIQKEIEDISISDSLNDAYSEIISEDPVLHVYDKGF